MKSKRMVRVDEFLKKRGVEGATGIEICCHCAVVSPRDYIRRLREHGRMIETVEDGTNENGARVVRYVMREKVATDLFIK